MPRLLSPIPIKEPVTGQGGIMSGSWYRWLSELVLRLLAAAANVATNTVTGGAASIGTTTLVESIEGLYRVTYYARITAAAGVSSSLTVGISWTESGVSLTHSFTAITGNTITTTGSESYMVRADGGTIISYNTVYASNPAAAMTYSLEIAVELVA